MITKDQNPNVYIDIETFSGWNKPSLDDIEAPSNYKDPEKIKAYKEENLDKIWRKQALDSFKGTIISFAYAIEDNPVQCIFNTESEEQLMHDISDVITSIPYPIFVTHNGKRFDCVWLWHKSVKYGLKDLRIKLPHKESGFTSNVIDIMDTFSVTAYGSDTWKSLGDICTFLGLSGKGDMNGSLVHDKFVNKQYQEIIDYNKRDVEMIRTIYRML